MTYEPLLRYGNVFYHLVSFFGGSGVTVNDSSEISVLVFTFSHLNACGNINRLEKLNIKNTKTTSVAK